MSKTFKLNLPKKWKLKPKKPKLEIVPDLSKELGIETDPVKAKASLAAEKAKKAKFNAAALKESNAAAAAANAAKQKKKAEAKAIKAAAREQKKKDREAAKAAKKQAKADAKAAKAKALLEADKWHALGPKCCARVFLTGWGPRDAEGVQHFKQCHCNRVNWKPPEGLDVPVDENGFAIYLDPKKPNEAGFVAGEHAKRYCKKHSMYAATDGGQSDDTLPPACSQASRECAGVRGPTSKFQLKGHRMDVYDGLKLGDFFDDFGKTGLGIDRSTNPQNAAISIMRWWGSTEQKEYFRGIFEIPEDADVKAWLAEDKPDFFAKYGK